MADHEPPRPVPEVLGAGVLTGVIAGAAVGAIDALWSWGPSAQFAPGFLARARVVLFVACTHAAAIARVDPEQIFYLRSHGLPSSDAERLVVEGFLGALVERYREGPQREAIAERLGRRLELILG